MSTSPTAKPWHRLTAETHAAWAAFRVYLDLEPSERTTANAYRIYHNKPAAASNDVAKTFNGWASKYDWIRRAAEYDKWMSAEADRAVMRAMQKYENELADKKKHINDRALDVAELFFKRAEEIAKLPITKKTVETTDSDGRPLTIKFEPIKGIKLTDAARLVEVGDKIARLAVGLATERTQVELRDKLAEIAHESGIPLDEVAEIFRDTTGKVVLLQ